MQHNLAKSLVGLSIRFYNGLTKETTTDGEYVKNELKTLAQLCQVGDVTPREIVLGLARLKTYTNHYGVSPYFQKDYTLLITAICAKKRVALKDVHAMLNQDMVSIASNFSGFCHTLYSDYKLGGTHVKTVRKKVVASILYQLCDFKKRGLTPSQIETLKEYFL